MTDDRSLFRFSTRSSLFTETPLYAAAFPWDKVNIILKRTVSSLEPLWGDSLLFTNKFPEICGTHFIDLERMKGWVDLGATQWFWTQDP